MLKRVLPFFCVLVIVVSCFFALPSSAADLSDEELSELWSKVHEADKSFADSVFTREFFDSLPGLSSVSIQVSPDIDFSLFADHIWYLWPFYVIDDQNIVFLLPSDLGIGDCFSVATFFEEYSSLSVTKLVETTTPETSILSVFSIIAQSLGALFGVVIGLFYASETGLTFLGILAVAVLAFSVAFLLIRKLKEWLNFRK